jgi:hypothetical protein
MHPPLISVQCLKNSDIRRTVFTFPHLRVVKYELFNPSFLYLLTMHLDNLCKENQLNALFIFNLFCHSTSTCFRHMLPIIRRYKLCMYIDL